MKPARRRTSSPPPRASASHAESLRFAFCIAAALAVLALFILGIHALSPVSR